MFSRTTLSYPAVAGAFHGLFPARVLTEIEIETDYKYAVWYQINQKARGVPGVRGRILRSPGLNKCLIMLGVLGLPLQPIVAQPSGVVP